MLHIYYDVLLQQAHCFHFQVEVVFLLHAVLWILSYILSARKIRWRLASPKHETEREHEQPKKTESR